MPFSEMPDFRGDTLVSLLRFRATNQPERIAYRFLEDGEKVEIAVTYAELDRMARTVAVQLQQLNAVGERALLLYPPGIDYIATFFGCLYAGVIAVPAYPPRLNRPSPRIQGMVADAQATIALATTSILENIERRFEHMPGLAALKWLNTELMTGESANEWQEPAISADTLAFLQYTSGSTSAPKGVMVSHGNLIHNLEIIRNGFQIIDGIGVFWLPSYHDMGLIGGVLEPMYVNGPSILMSPAAFLQRPVRWLEAISTYKGTISGAPNFAYQMCVDKITDEQMERLDLSSWGLAFSGAEPIRHETMEAFARRFEAVGFRRDAFYPCYGLAEGTLLVAGGVGSAEINSATFDLAELAQNKVVTTDPKQPGAQTMVSVGRSLLDQEVIIVDPETLTTCPPEKVGEIWVSGRSVARGYWGRQEQSQTTFQAMTADTNNGPYLRTGDLGFFHQGELFITGRLKDLIIIRGRNHYPQDIELTVEQSHIAFEPSMGAAFSVEVDGEEQLVVAYEATRQHRKADINEVAAAARKAVAENHQLRLHALVLLKPMSIPKTSSGKVKRHACRLGYLDGSLNVINEWHSSDLFVDHTAVPVLTPVPPIEKAADISPIRSEAQKEQSNIQNWLVERVAALMKVAPARIDIQEPFAYYGLDSAQAVELAGDLETWLGRSLSPTLIWDYPNIAELSAHLAGIEPVEMTTELANTPDELSRPVTEHVEVSDPIVVVGLSCRFPGAENADAFWQNLSQGIDSITEVPADRWNAADFYDEAGTRGKMTTRWGGFLDNIDLFDPKFFGISPREASRMDPQQRMLLEVAWEALENAGQNPDDLAGSRTGVFVGISSYDYSHLQFSSADLIDAYAGTGNAHSLAANRLSYVLDLQGPSMAIDTACSSSLVAIHQAIRSLRSGESDLALAGGVNLLLSPELTIAFSQARMMAADGHCKTFDANADGYVRGEGCGIVVLKRLSDAERDGDPILAVLMGSAVNQDGRSNGLTAPNGRAQQAVIRQAMKDAGVKAADIDYIEAHGTGTPLGDPIEIASLRAVLDGEDGRTIQVGSVKTNIGHLESAAGIAGLIKVILSLQHDQIPPHLNYTELNPYINLEGSSLNIARDGAPWSRRETEQKIGGRIAGVSSFGFGGTNAHVIIGDYKDTTEIIPLDPDFDDFVERPLHILALSARSEASLQTLAEQYALHLQEQSETPFADIAFSANTIRKHFDYRLAVTGSDNTAVAQKLAAFAADTTAVPERNRSREKIAFLFTGQGAQFPGMGWELFETQPVFREALMRCAEILDAYLERPLLEIMFAEPDTEAANWLNNTGFTQPALFALEYSLAQLWMSWGIRPDAVMGHSVGEYVAACLAGVFSLEDGLKLISARSQLMATLPEEGAMVAVFAPESVVLETLSEFNGSALVGVAAVNGPQSVVISGESLAVQKATGYLGRQGVETRPLVVSHAFHSPMMEPILDIFEEVAEQIQYHPPQIPFISNLDGSLMETAPQARYWREHIRRPVYFADGLQNLHEQGVRIFLEVGPQPHLLGMGRRCLLNTDLEANLTWLPSLRPPKESWDVMLDSLGRLYQAGFDIDWRAFDDSYTRRKATLPTYPFDRQRYWIETAGESLNTNRVSSTERIYSEQGMAVNKLATAVPLFEAVLDNRTTGGWTMAYNRTLQAIGSHLWGLGSHQSSIIVSEAGQQPGQAVVQMSLTLLSEGEAAVQLFRQQANSWQLIGSGQISRGRSDGPESDQTVTANEQFEEESQTDETTILAFLRQQAASALGLAPINLPQDQPLDSLGMDSLMAIEMRSAIERELKVTLPVVEFLQGPTLLDLAARIEELLNTGSGVKAIERYEAAGPHPLTHSQQAMWFLHELLPENVSLNVSGAVRLIGPLDTASLHHSLTTIIERHPALRTTYTLEDGLPVQNVGRFSKSTFTADYFIEVDTTHWSDQQIQTHLEKEANRPFDLEHGPLIRLVILRRSEQEHILLLSVNHIAADFWSMSLIVQELYLGYAAEIGEIHPISFPELPLRYTDYARWSRAMLDGEEGRRLQAYWLEQLKGELPLLNLPTDRPRPAAQQFDGRMAHLILPAGLSEKLHTLSQKHGATLYMTLLAAFQTLLHRYSGQDDLLVGSVLAGRDRPELAGLVGYFINPVAMRADFTGSPTFVDLLAQVRERVLGAIDHQQYPLPLLADQLQFKRDPGRPPIFETMFIMQKAQADGQAALGVNMNALALGLPGARLEMGSLSAESLSLNNLPAQFDLTLMMTEVEAGLAAALHYNTALFNRETAQRMLSHLESLLVGIAAEPAKPVARIPLLSKSERKRLLVDWNQTDAVYPSRSGFFQLFEEQVQRTPEKSAVVDGRHTYSYTELNQRANRLAHYLKTLGIQSEKTVGVAVERSAEMVVALLAVHKAGGTYIPLDPAFPESRLAMMLDDARPAVLLTESALLEDGSLSWLQTKRGEMAVISLDSQWPEIEQFSAENPNTYLNPDSLAYIIYTSGSTGKPKGVQISHRALVNFLTTMAEKPGISPDDTLLAVTTLSFDIAGLELFLPLMVGATIVIAGRETAADGYQLQQTMADNHITMMQATPATWQLLLAANWPGIEGLKILSGGEALPAELAAALLARSAELWNVYGPTETTIWSTVHKVEPADSSDSGRAVSIGRPIGNTQIYILDRQMQPVPTGIVGDLYIGGDGLARGYYRRFGLTADRFVPHPFAEGQRLYRTGDLARYLPDGRIIFLGRNDFQVKIRGYRVELGDIEAALDQLPAVAQSVVAAKTGSQSEQRLVAYLIARKDVEMPPVEEMRTLLAEKLPAYMIPAVFMTLDAFPLTPNNKVNRQALPQPEMERGQIATRYAAPRTPLEQELADLCAAILGLEKVGIHDSFFDLGGNSLTATRLMSQVREIAGGPVSLRLLFAEPTVAGLARAIEAGRSGGSPGSLFEEKTVEELLAEAQLDPTITAGNRPYEPLAEPENILLTGATGFVGAFLLRDLLVETKAAVHCLVRAADKEAGIRRLEKNLARYGLWQTDFSDRIVPVLGDLGQPRLGLTAEQFDQLAHTVDVIYHNGALVNFVYPYESHKAANVRGTEEILRLAVTGDLKPVHFVSTLSVFHTGHHDDGTIFAEQDDLEQVGVPFGGYAQSKWVAEKMVMTAVQRGIPAAIYRPGLVSGDSCTGAWNTADMMTTLARASLAIGAVPELDVQVDIVPVNYVSRAIVALSKRPESVGGIFHLANTGPLTYGDLLAWVEEQGLTIEQVPFVEWRKRLAELMTAVGGEEVAAFAPLLDEVTAEQIFMPAINCANTLAGLEGTDVQCAPVDGRLLSTYLTHLTGEGIS